MFDASHSNALSAIKARSSLLSKLGGQIDLRRGHPDRGQSAYALGLCQVVQVNYEDFYVTLRTTVGTEQEFERIPVPLSFPSVGKRHFFGAMPQEGDMAIVGWVPQESSKPRGTKIPVIIAWAVPGSWMGHDWQIEQPFTVDELDMTSRDKAMLEGTFSRVRHKLRHMQPGNIVCSSGQGADLVLDESALLANRRGNEILLRDQDQAIVVRSLQQFHAMAGARVYAGMVQRDGALIQTQMVSDGLEWDQHRQYMGFGLEGRPVFGGPESRAPNPDGSKPILARSSVNVSDGSDTTEGAFSTGFLSDHIGFELGQLTPARPLARRFSNGTLMSPMITLKKGGDRIDPYNVFARAGFADGLGQVTPLLPDGASFNIFSSDTVYGGKPYRRVSTVDNEGYVNNTVDEGMAGKSLVEYRIEVAHTSNGTLPVTEQTDGFDSDRLPGDTTNSISENSPYIEIVYGSVVGNDPMSSEGKETYGVPLKPVVFDEDGVMKAGMEPFGDAPINEHAATLFSLTPLSTLGSSDAAPTFASFTKGGSLKSFINGGKSNSVELACNGPIVVNAPATRITGGVSIKGTTTNPLNHGFDVKVPRGAIWIEAGGQTEVGAVAGRLGMTPAKADLPGLMLKSRKPIAIDTDEKVLMSATEIRGEANNNIELNAVSGDLVVKAGEKIRFSAKEYNFNSTGKIVFSAGGPEDGLPTSGPNEDITYSRTFVGDCRTVTANMGDHVHKMGTMGPCNRKRTIFLGNDEKHTVAGQQTIKVAFGATQANFSPNGMTMSTIGNTMIAAQAAATFFGQASATMASNGLATVAGSVVTLAATSGNKKGMILSSMDICPATGQPYASPIHGQMGSTGHFLG